MAESSRVKDTAEVVKGIAEAVPVYTDLLQPAVRELGTGLATVAKTVHVALAPVSALVWGYDRIKEFVTARISEHLKATPEEMIETPAPHVAGPALEALRFTDALPDLRELYAKLLATAMDVRTRDSVHPSFVEVIRQLDSQEARILARIGYSTFPAIEIFAVHPTERGNRVIVRHFSPVCTAAGCPLDDAERHIDNLIRLGLVHVYDGILRGADYEVVRLEAEDLGILSHFLSEHPDETLELNPKILNLTRFGAEFFSACVAESPANVHAVE